MRKDHWEPSSNKILASASDSKDVIVATAVFNKHVEFLAVLVLLEVRVMREAVSDIAWRLVFPCVAFPCAVELVGTVELCLCRTVAQTGMVTAIAVAAAIS